MAIQILPGIDEYLAKGIQNLGDTISLFTETDRATQRAIRNMLLQKPEMIQEFADLEAEAPGSLKRLGFGKIADMVSQVGPSMDLQRKQRLGSRQLSLEESELGLQEFKMNAVQSILSQNPQMSEGQAEALFNEFMGVPSETELRLEELSVPRAEYQALIANLMMEGAEAGDNLQGPMFDYVAQWRAGRDDPEATKAILSHPVLGPQFELMNQLQQQREAQELKDQGMEPETIADLPVRVQELFTSIGPVKSAIIEYEYYVNKFLALPVEDRAIAMIGQGPHQELVGMIRSKKSALMGTLRPLLSPGPLSVADMRMLDRMLGTIFTMSPWIRGPEYVAGQLKGATGYIDMKINSVRSLYPNVEIPKTPPEYIPQDLLRDLVNSGYTNDQIKQLIERMGFDVVGGTGGR